MSCRGHNNMIGNKKILLLSILSTFISIGHVYANSFSITPTKIEIDNIKPGQTFHTIIETTRDKYLEENILNILIEKKDINESWLNYHNNQEIVYSKDKKNLEIPITISVPKNAVTGKYLGNLQFIMEDKKLNSNNTSIKTKLGHQIPIEINVTKNDVKKISINWISWVESDGVNKLKSVTIPGIITLGVSINNTGNTKTGIKKIKLLIYDEKREKLLTTLINNNLPNINPFEEKKIFIDLYHYLPLGKYSTDIEIYNDEQYKPIFKQRKDIQIKEGILSKRDIVKRFYKTNKTVPIVVFLVLFLILMKRVAKKGTKPR